MRQPLQKNPHYLPAVKTSSSTPETKRTLHVNYTSLFKFKFKFKKALNLIFQAMTEIPIALRLQGGKHKIRIGS